MIGWLRGWRQDRLFGRVVKNSSYLFASYAIGALLTILTARLLGAVEFGVLGTVTVFVANVNRLFSFRMGDVVVRYMGAALELGQKERAAAVVKASMLAESLTSLVAFGVLALLAPLAAIYIARDAQAASLFRIYGISILAGATFESSTGVLQVTGHYRSQALIYFIQTVLVAVLLGLAAVFQADLMTVLAIYLAGKLILNLGPLVLAFHWLPRVLGRGWLRTPLSALPPAGEMARFAASTNFHGTVNMVARDSEVPIVSFFFGPAAAGYYKIALALINLIIQPIDPFIKTTYPEITRAVAGGAWGQLRTLLQRVTTISAGWTGVVALGLLLFGKPLLFQPWSLFGRTVSLLPGYAPAYPIVLILLAGFGAANVLFWNRPLLLAQGEAGYPLRVSFWTMLAKVGLTLLLLPGAGVWGAAALLSGYLLVTVLLSTGRGLALVRKSQADAEAAGALRGEVARVIEMHSAMRTIACISTSRVPSSAANSIQVMKAVHALAELGWNIRLLAPGQADVDAQDAAWPALAEQYGLETPFAIRWLRAIPRFKRNDFAWLAVRQARRLGASAVYTWTGQSAVFALLAGLPVLYEIHDLPTGRLGPLWFRLFLRLPGRKRMLIITDALKQRLEEAYGVFPTGAAIIAPNGVDLRQYEALPGPEQARAALELPQAPTVQCSGHLYAGRGAALFLRLARRFPQASFVWTGGRAEDVAAWQQRARGDGLDNVRFTGFIPQRQLPCYQAAADVLLMPYERQIAVSGGAIGAGNSAEIASPMKMFDYLAAGRAILASDLPVFHEVLNARNAVFAPAEEEPAWADALEKLLGDAALRERLGGQARADARRYTWRARAERALAGFLE